MRLLNLLNGDCAYAGWEESALPGEVLVWRENYLQGEIPRTEDREAFNRIRAAELHRVAPDKPEAEIFAELLRMERDLLSLAESDRLILWFDVCPFDRAMQARVLYLLNGMARPPRIRLICEDVVWDAAAFRRHATGGVELTRAALQRAAAAWPVALTFRDA